MNINPIQILFEFSLQQNNSTPLNGGSGNLAARLSDSGILLLLCVDISLNIFVVKGLREWLKQNFKKITPVFIQLLHLPLD